MFKTNNLIKIHYSIGEETNNKNFFFSMIINYEKLIIYYCANKSRELFFEEMAVIIRNSMNK